MEGIWGKSKEKFYSPAALKLFDERVDKLRDDFLKEFSSALANTIESGLYACSRFYSNDQILWVLRSKIEENEFISSPDFYIMSILLGACETDYYYTFEKDWG